MYSSVVIAAITAAAVIGDGGGVVNVVMSIFSLWTHNIELPVLYNNKESIINIQYLCSSMFYIHCNPDCDCECVSCVMLSKRL